MTILEENLAGLGKIGQFKFWFSGGAPAPLLGKAIRPESRRSTKK
jgi:hypothetical protein